MTDPVPVLPPRAVGVRQPLVLFGLLTVGMVLFLRFQGRVWWCACGEWYPVSLDINSQHNSQHLVDPYFLSHVLHGFIFFGLLWIFSDRFGLAWRFLFAAVIEIAWEMLENSPVVINLYRDNTVSLGYTGDSILNSLGDLAGFAIGFLIARRVGLWGSVGICLAVEIGMLFWIRDNLTLNVLMLLWKNDAIRTWQAGG